MRCEREVAASPERLWAFVGDVERWAELLPTIRRVVRLGPDGPVGVGARFEVHQPGLPKAVYEVTDWQPGRGFTWVSSAPGVRTTAVHTLAPRDGGTRLVLGIDWSGPLAGLVRLLVGSKARGMVAQEADTFVVLAEGADERG
jgi:uncharacterized protein YndB with AHSA1/START domain